jgi:hypothetical protein
LLCCLHFVWLYRFCSFFCKTNQYNSRDNKLSNFLSTIKKDWE